MSLRHCTGTGAPFSVAETFRAAKAAGDVPKPEPVTVVTVPPSGFSTALLPSAPLSGTMKVTAAAGAMRVPAPAYRLDGVKVNV